MKGEKSMGLKVVNMDDKDEYTNYSKKKKHDKFVKENKNATKTESSYKNNEDLKDANLEIPQADLKGKVIKIDQLRVRNAPEGDIIKLINKGDEVIIVSDYDDIWYKVQLADGTIGFCMKEYLNVFIEGDIDGNNDSRRCKAWPIT